jgi:hypothetical protein
MRLGRSWTTFLLLAAATVQVYGYSPDETPSDDQTIATLEARVEQAPARDQCFLYAQLIHKMTEFSLRQYAAGDIQKADAMLVRVEKVANKMHLSLADNDKRLKNAEILLRHTAFRLNEMLHASSYEDRPLVAQALAQVNQASDAAMMDVFKK